MAIEGNNFHEIFQDTDAGYDSATITDYELSVTGIDIAKQVGDEIKTPTDLIEVLRTRLGPKGPGYTGPEVDPLKWKTPDN